MTSISDVSSICPISVTLDMPSFIICYASLLSVSLKNVTLENQVLRIQQFNLMADSSTILQCSPIEVSLSVVPSPFVSSWSLIERAWTESPLFWAESKYIELPDEWLSKPYSNYFYLQPPINHVECKLPSVFVTVDRVAMISILKLLPSFLFSHGMTFHYPSVVSYSPPGWEFHLSCPFLSLSILNDVVSDQDMSETFCCVDLDAIDLNMKLGSQQFDLMTSFHSLSLVSRFQHLASPLMLETLTGYDDSMSSAAWENCCHRYQQLKPGMTELVTISSSSLHLIQRPHVIPTGNSRIITDYLNSRESVDTLSLMFPLSFGNSYSVIADLGVIQVHFDDVCVSDLVHAVLTITDLILLNQNETQLEMCDECEFQHPFLVSVTTPLLSLDLSYNQKLFQNLTLPSVYFEFGFPRHYLNDDLVVGSFECGATCEGIYWTDYTTESMTHTV